MVVLPLPILRSDLIRRPGEGLRFGKPMSCAARNPPANTCASARAAIRMVAPISGRYLIDSTSGTLRRSGQFIIPSSRFFKSPL